MMVIDSCRLPQMTKSIPIALHVHHRALHYNLELHCIHGLCRRLGRLLRVQGYLHLISLCHAGEVERMRTFSLRQIECFRELERLLPNILYYQSIHTDWFTLTSNRCGGTVSEFRIYINPPFWLLKYYSFILISTLISMATQIASNRHFGGHNTRFKHSSSVLGMCMQQAHTISD